MLIDVKDFQTVAQRHTCPPREMPPKADKGQSLAMFARRRGGTTVRHARGSRQKPIDANHSRYFFRRAGTARRGGMTTDANPCQPMLVFPHGFPPPRGGAVRAGC